MKPSKPKRFWEIDALRGIAIIMMIIFHFLFTLNYFGLTSFQLYKGFLLFFQRITVSSFIMLAGVSLVLSYFNYYKINYIKNNKKNTKDNKKIKSIFDIYPKYLKRGLIIFACGLLITLATYVLIGRGFIVFGVLHSIGISIMIAPFFIRFKNLNLYLGIAIILIGLYFSFFRAPHINPIINLILLSIGLFTADFYSFDYVPLFPWFGLVLIGIYLGKYFYPNGSRNFKIFKLELTGTKNRSLIGSTINSLANSLVYLGKKSLLIYLIHEPILVLLVQLYILFT